MNPPSVERGECEGDNIMPNNQTSACQYYGCKKSAMHKVDTGLGDGFLCGEHFREYALGHPIFTPAEAPKRKFDMDEFFAGAKEAGEILRKKDSPAPKTLEELRKDPEFQKLKRRLAEGINNSDAPNTSWEERFKQKFWWKYEGTSETNKFSASECETLIDFLCQEIKTAREEERGEIIMNSQGFIEKTVMPAAMITSIQSQAIAKDREELKMEIRRMKLWSKGTVEGTRNDILALLDKKN